MTSNQFYKISGIKDDKRLPSRVVEEMVLKEVNRGRRKLEIEAFGQHGIGGRIWKTGREPVHIRITGHSGQRTGSLGFPNTRIEVLGPASDDVGWLNAGAEIIVHGHASNGTMNGAAQGKVYIAGSIGARGMTMTKHNPRFDPPELWVLGAAGDYFGEFMAGGTTVICGHGMHKRPDVIGYRPFVGMVGGRAFVRGSVDDISDKDAKIVPIPDDEWDWLSANLREFLSKIGKEELFKLLSKRSEWNLVRAKSQQEKLKMDRHSSMTQFRKESWDRELGEGGLIGDIQRIDNEPVPLVASGELRRFVPVWENRKYKAPCQTACPTGIPVQERWHMIRSGLTDEALKTGLNYSPFPATVCGYLCPNPCMGSCTRGMAGMPAIDVKKLGCACKELSVPDVPEKSGGRVAVIGAGPAGISVAWHLSLKGHEAVLFDQSDDIGGKIKSVIPESRYDTKTFETELDRVKQLVSKIRLNTTVDEKEFRRIRKKYDYTVVATGSSLPRLPGIEGIERAEPAMDFLWAARKNAAEPGEKMVIIGAGNVGCDVATEAHRLGAKQITLIDVQKPASFGEERDAAERVGAQFRWPCFTSRITEEGVELKDGEIIEADRVIVSIGEYPDTGWVKNQVETKHDFISVDPVFRTSDSRVFAIGDCVTPGLLTEAIGMGKRTAETLDRLINGEDPETLVDEREQIDIDRVSLEYFSPLKNTFESLEECAGECASCGRCRDCGICTAVCPEGAISRAKASNKEFEYIVDGDRCIGCGFCAGACPCGVWSLVPNTPL